MGTKKKDSARSSSPMNIKEIEEKIGYTFRDKSLLVQAFTRTSFVNENKGEGGEEYQSNEVLEFFGDSVLSLAIVTLIIKDFSKRYTYGIKTRLAEGDFSNIKAALSDKKNLSDRMRELGIYTYLKMGEGDAKLSIEKEPSVMEDLFESIIGAIYIDSDMNMAAVIGSVSRMLTVSDYIEKSKTPPIQSHKNALQEWCADKRRRLPPPQYKTESESGPEHKKLYEVGCYIGARRCGVGIGKNRKLAEAAAAEKALILLKEEESRKQGAERSDTQTVQKLLDVMRRKNLGAPSFFDMGESEDSTPTRPQYKVGCRVLEMSAVGIGASKSEARVNAAAKILRELEKSERKTVKNNNKSSKNSKK